MKLICLFIPLFFLQNANKNGYNLLVLFEGSIWFYMYMLSLDSTKVTGVSGNTISDLYYPCQQNSILSMCCLNKTITTLNQSVFNIFHALHLLVSFNTYLPKYNIANKQLLTCLKFALQSLLNEATERNVGYSRAYVSVKHN